MPTIPDSIEFEMGNVDEIPKQQGSVRRSKYDKPLFEFVNSKLEKAELLLKNVSGEDVQYVRNQIKKRIDIHDLSEKVEVSHIGNKVYFEKIYS